MSSKKNQHCATHAHFSPCIYEVDEGKHIPRRNSKNRPVGVKSLLDSNFKRFRDTVLRRKFKLKPETHIKKTQFINRGNYIQEYNEVKEKL